MLDYISDIGGMESMLISGAAVFLAIWNFNNFDNYLVSQLYRLPSADKDDDGEGRVMKPRCINNVVDYLCSFVPRKC